VYEISGSYLRDYSKLPVSTPPFRHLTSLNVTSTAFGQIGSVRDPRTMQLSLKFIF